MISAQKRIVGEALRGHTFSYDYDDIGNRNSPAGMESGGDEAGNGLRQFNYTSNEWNQVTQIWNTDTVELFGKAHSGDLVDVTYGPPGGGSQSVQAEQQDEFFRVEMNADNTNGPVWLDFEALIEGIHEAEGSLYVPPQTEMFAYDDDGNLTRDGRWEYRWNGENRLREMETHQEGNAGIPKVKLSFAYDNLGRRFKKTVHSNWVASAYQDVETSYYVYDRRNPILEYTISGEGPLEGGAPAAPTHSFVWGLDLAGQRTGREEDAQNAGGVGGLVLLVNGGAGTTAANQSFVPGFDGNGNVVAYVNLVSGQRSLSSGGDQRCHTMHTYGIYERRSPGNHHQERSHGTRALHPAV